VCVVDDFFLFVLLSVQMPRLCCWSCLMVVYVGTYFCVAHLGVQFC